MDATPLQARRKKALAEAAKKRPGGGARGPGLGVSPAVPPADPTGSSATAAECGSGGMLRALRGPPRGRALLRGARRSASRGGAADGGCGDLAGQWDERRASSQLRCAHRPHTCHGLLPGPIKKSEVLQFPSRCWRWETNLTIGPTR
jgi:hypothetical protein